MTIPNAARQLHSSALVMDAHVHPSLKTCLFGRKLHRKHRSGGAFNPFTLRVDLPKTKAGGVDAMVSSVYLPERGLLNDCPALKLLSKVAPRRIRRLFKGNPFEKTIAILDGFEAAIDRANGRGGELARVMGSADEVRRARDDGVIAILHAVEGAHSLGGRVDHVEALWNRGVCMLTLAHFYVNEVAAPVVGILPRMQRLGCFKQPKDLELGLGPLGPQVIEEMLRLGMIIDLTHCTPKARHQAYGICGARRPLVFSHVGVQPLADDPMSPTEDEIRQIASTGGVIAVIFMNTWLGEYENESGLDAIVATIRQITEIGGVDSVAIGSDFDGFTEPPDDLKDIAEMPKLTDALMRSGFGDSEIEKILGLNMERVLRDGWR